MPDPKDPTRSVLLRGDDLVTYSSGGLGAFLLWAGFLIFCIAAGTRFHNELGDIWTHWVGRPGLLVLPSLLLPFVGPVLGIRNLRSEETQQFGIVFLVLGAPWVLLIAASFLLLW